MARPKPLKIAKAVVSPGAQMRKGPTAITSTNRCYTLGMPIGTTVHLRATRGEDGPDGKTICGNWPGRAMASLGGQKECCICFKPKPP